MIGNVNNCTSGGDLPAPRPVNNINCRCYSIVRDTSRLLNVRSLVGALLPADGYAALRSNRCRLNLNRIIFYISSSLTLSCWNIIFLFLKRLDHVVYEIRSQSILLIYMCITVIGRRGIVWQIEVRAKLLEGFSDHGETRLKESDSLKSNVENHSKCVKIPVEFTFPRIARSRRKRPRCVSWVFHDTNIFPACWNSAFPFSPVPTNGVLAVAPSPSPSPSPSS